jgi:Mn2+/Fe2+ NRAMP family transporter
VAAGVSAPEGSALLGQSFLTRFKTWSIDNTQERLALVFQ